MRARTALVLLSTLIVSPWLLGGALPVGARAEQFTLKVVNVDKVQKRLFSLSNLVGSDAATPKKVVVLSFFATYCEPCKRELPFLQQLYERYAEQGLGVMVVSIDRDRDVPGGAANAIGELAKQHGLTYPVLHDRFNIVAKRYAVAKLPCLYLIDGEGRIAMHSVGYTDDYSATLASELQKRLGVPLEKIKHAKAAKPHGKAK